MILKKHLKPSRETSVDEESFNFLRKGKLILRSQLDCKDDSIEGPSKIFRLKNSSNS